MTNYERTGYIGNPKQLFGVRRMTIEEGKAGGTHVIEVYTAGGLQIDILPDLGLDIGQVRFKGTNMSWMSKNGYDSPAVFHPFESDFLTTFSGGLLYTCGLRNTGIANRDNGEYHPQHGRIHGIPAEQVCAEVSGDEIVVRGLIRETQLFGHALELRREIRIPCFGTSVTVHDTITNLTPRPEEFLLLYHCNFGYPLLSEHAALSFPEEHSITGRTPFAENALDRFSYFEAPVDGEEERCYFHTLKQDFRAKLENTELGMGVDFSWSGETLPTLVQWRSMASGDYVLGLEPSNSLLYGRSGERANGTLPVLEAFGSVETMLKYEFFAQ